MPVIVFLSASQYSGSTLASFLLNTHSRFTTVGHTTGWHFGDKEEFPCSCGRTLDLCPLYVAIAEAYASRSLTFDIREFGTEFQLAKNERLNRYLVASPPVVQSSLVERIRDRVVASIPAFSRTLARQLENNRTFIDTALDYAGASVYVDNSHDPYRLRHLMRLGGFRLLNIHLVRDPRGVVLSCMKHAGWQPALAARLWLRRQSDIIRISSELPEPGLTVHYEDLCTDVDSELARIHEFAGEAHEPFPGTFDGAEHHILGNAMRLREGRVRLDEKWRTELTDAQVREVDESLAAAARTTDDERMKALVRRYVPAD